MSWPYQFVTLSPEQVEARRKVLDRNGFYAYLTPIIIFAVTKAYQITSRKLQSRYAVEKDGLVSPLTVNLRRAKWWLSESLTPEFGSRQVHVFGLAYALWLLFLSFRQTSNDYLHLTKQIGHVAVSQLPLHYLLAFKSPRSPIQLITGLSHESLLPYHRLFGRMVHLLFLVHAVLYLNFFSQVNLLSKRLGDRDVRLGVLSILLFDILAVTAIPPIRKFAYHAVFYRTHILISVAVLPALFFHVSYTRIYIVQCFLFAAGNAMLRKSGTSQPLSGTVKVAVEGTDLVRLSVPGPAWGIPPFIGGKLATWVPGQHIYIKQSMSPKLPRSPFSIVSLPPDRSRESDDETNSGKLEFVFRNTNGPMTGWLASKPRETGLKARNVEVLVEGPYGESAEYVPSLIENEDGDVLLVAGGVGATFTLPVYLALLQGITRRNSASTLSRNRKVIFVWVVRNRHDSLWLIEDLRRSNIISLKEKHNINIDMRVFITNSSLPSTTTAPHISSPLTTPTATTTSYSIPHGGIDLPAPGISVTNSLTYTLPPTSPSLTTTNSTTPNHPTKSLLEITARDLLLPPSPPMTPPIEDFNLPGLTINETGSRPNLGALVDEIMSNKNDISKTTTVLTCGPREMGTELRREVGRWVWKEGRDVRFREEVYGHG